MDNATVKFLEEICRNASLSKYRHFHAASRNKFLNNFLGVPVVVVNIILGSLLFWTISQELADITKWIGAVLALCAALCSGIQTFFNFNRKFEGHRRIANRYLKVAYDCQRLLCEFNDGLIDLNELLPHIEQIQDIYNAINEDAEVYPTTERDYQKALSKERERMEGLDERCLC